MGGHLKRKRSRLKGMVNRTSPSGGLLIGSDSSEQREVKSIYIYITYNTVATVPNIKAQILSSRDLLIFLGVSCVSGYVIDLSSFYSSVY